MQRKEVLTFKLYGALADLQDILEGIRPVPQEILVEGPAGTGKSYAICALLVRLCLMFPGSRGLMVKKTLKSMRETILPTWEYHALPFTMDGKSKKNLQNPVYVFPGKTEVVCHGFDDPEKIKSGEFDWMYANEGNLLEEADWDIGLSRLRGRPQCPTFEPGRFGIIDTNPDHPGHWILKRTKKNARDPITGKLLKRKQMIHIPTRLDDNPAYVDPETKEYTVEGQQYLGLLDRLEGVRYKRLRLGLWVAAEGAIWPNFDSDIHVVNAPLEKGNTSDGEDPEKFYVTHGDRRVSFVNFIASVDWGFRDPGTIQVYGLTDDRTAYMVHEVYRIEKDIDWWAQKAKELLDKYSIFRFFCDPSRPDNIQLFNKRMVGHGGEWLGKRELFSKAKNSIEAGFSVVRQRLTERRVFFLADALDEMDPYLYDTRQPFRLTDEVPGYCYRPAEEDKNIGEEPKPGSVDHGCDALRYAMMAVDGKDYREAEQEARWSPGSMAARLEHDKVLFT